MIRLALYEPDIAPNVGAAIRLCACLGVPLDVIGPCGFIWDEKRVRQAALDYIEHVSLARHDSWGAFKVQQQGRLVLLTTKAAQPFTQFDFHQGDTILLGRESAGVPEDVHAAADARLVVPMQPGLRSLNVVTAGTLVLGEALRQVGKL